MSCAASRAGRRHGSPWTVPPRYVGRFFLWTSGVHVGIVAADPGLYRHFADDALLWGLTAAWRSTFMPHAAIAGLVVAAGEAMFGLLLLGPWSWRRLGWGGTIVFHLALMAFGWGFWLWCVPATALLARGAIEDRRSLMLLDRPLVGPSPTVESSS
jgi:hypothetical protein